MATNKVALITGANKGIGLEIARQLGRQGVAVLMGARDEGRGREAADRLRTEGIDARPVRLDVTDQVAINPAPHAEPLLLSPNDIHGAWPDVPVPGRTTGAGGAPPPSRSLHLETSWPGAVRKPTLLHPFHLLP